MTVTSKEATAEYFDGTYFLPKGKKQHLCEQQI